MEKLILALVNTSRKLRPYFKAHTIEIPTEIPNEAGATQTGDLGKVDEVGHRAERVGHQIQTKNSNKMAYLSRLRHGIHLGRACRSCSNDARPPHLEVVRRQGRQCTREWCRSNFDLSRRNRYRICPKIWVSSLQ